MRKYLLAALAAVLMLGGSAAPAGAKAAPKCNDSYALHAARTHVKASCGQRVSDLQWLLAGHRPSVYRSTRPTYRWAPNGAYGARTKAAVKAMKFRIGYPEAGQCGSRGNDVTDTASSTFFAILEGHKPRPACWVGLAAKRIKGTVQPGATRAALAIKEFELSQLGVHEVPDGSNRGPRISYRAGGIGPYQGSTGAYGLAWCASFADYGLKLITGHGFGSSNDAYTPTIAEYAQAHGWLQAKPRVGSYVEFLNAAGQVKALGSAYHIGYVVKVMASGVETVEGNEGNAVREVYRPFAAYNMVYVNVPGVA
jgi:hypothetical protein